MTLVLSLFPGIGLLDRAFEEVGFCVVRGPDVLWGGDIKRFHPPAGKFDGVIGGPPCQKFSVLNRLLKATGRETKALDLIPDFCRCVAEAEPDWFLMENVPEAPEPEVSGFVVRRYIVTDWKTGGKTKRRRAFCFGDRTGRCLAISQDKWPAGRPHRAVTRNVRVPDERHHQKRKGKGGLFPGDGRYLPIEDVCELQGLPRDWAKTSPFRMEAIRVMLGNGVPMAMGRAMAEAVKELLAGVTTQ